MDPSKVIYKPNQKSQKVRPPFQKQIFNSWKPFLKTVCWGKRHTFVLLAFLGTANAYAIRINLSVAIVGMVKPSGK